MSAAEKIASPNSAGITSTWWRHKQVLAHLDVDGKTLRRRMHENPDHIEQPWINIGSTRRPEYRWLSGEVDRWWIEVNRWRVSTDAMGAGVSVGATRMAGRGAGSAPRERSPRSSKPRSNRPSPKGTDGSLVMRVKKQISGSS